MRIAIIGAGAAGCFAAANISLQQGDEVVTASCILGKIAELSDKVVTLEIADSVKIKVLKSQIAQVIKGQLKDLTP